MTSDAAVAFGWLRQRNDRLQEPLLNSRTGGARGARPARSSPAKPIITWLDQDILATMNGLLP
jgi:hypothetical protein